MADDCLIVHLKLSNGDHGTPAEQQSIRALSSRLEEIVTENGVGEYDGDEFGGGECTLYFYGSDGDKLFEAVRETLEQSPLTGNGYALKQYDLEKGIPDKRVDFH